MSTVLQKENGRHEPMAPAKDDVAETEKDTLQDSQAALAEESGNRTSNDWPDVGRRPL